MHHNRTMIQRRSFLGAMLAACAGPAIVRASSLMPGRALVASAAGVIYHEDAFALVAPAWPTILGAPDMKQGDIITIAGRPECYRIGQTINGATQLRSYLTPQAQSFMARMWDRSKASGSRVYA